MKKGTASVYLATFSSLKRFIKRDALDISEINKSFLQEFETHIKNEPSHRGANRKFTPKEQQPKGERAISAYLTCVRAIFNKARDKYNDDDRGIIRIPHYPFKNFKIKPEPITKKRAISVAEIQSIIDLQPQGGRFDLARDCFLISLGLMGMNSADLYFAEPEKLGIITYQRQKTRDRRRDKAELRIRIETCVSAFIEKYSDKKPRKPAPARLMND